MTNILADNWHIFKADVAIEGVPELTIDGSARDAYEVSKNPDLATEYQKYIHHGTQYSFKMPSNLEEYAVTIYPMFFRNINTNIGKIKKIKESVRFINFAKCACIMSWIVHDSQRNVLLGRYRRLYRIIKEKFSVGTKTYSDDEFELDLKLIDIQRAIDFDTDIMTIDTDYIMNAMIDGNDRLNSVVNAIYDVSSIQFPNISHNDIVNIYNIDKENIDVKSLYLLAGMSMYNKKGEYIGILSHYVSPRALTANILTDTRTSIEYATNLIMSPSEEFYSLFGMSSPTISKKEMIKPVAGHLYFKDDLLYVLRERNGELVELSYSDMNDEELSKLPNNVKLLTGHDHYKYIYHFKITARVDEIILTKLETYFVKLKIYDINLQEMHNEFPTENFILFISQIMYYFFQSSSKFTYITQVLPRPILHAIFTGKYTPRLDVDAYITSFFNFCYDVEEIRCNVPVSKLSSFAADYFKEKGFSKYLGTLVLINEEQYFYKEDGKYWISEMFKNVLWRRLSEYLTGAAIEMSLNARIKTVHREVKAPPKLTEKNLFPSLDSDSD